MNSNTQNAKIEAITEKTLVIGIDVGSETHNARAFTWRGIELTKKVFEFSNDKEGFTSFKARKKKATTFLYISSMEVYGDMGGDVWATEDKFGFINPLSVRSDYPESKRMCENMCIAYSAEYGVNVKIARLAQTFGPGILPWEKRVFAQFAQAVIDEKDIILHTKGESEENYCYLADMAVGIFTILLRGENKNAYNVVNEQTHCTIA